MAGVQSVLVESKRELFRVDIIQVYVSQKNSAKEEHFYKHFNRCSPLVVTPINQYKNAQLFYNTLMNVKWNNFSRRVK